MWRGRLFSLSSCRKKLRSGWNRHHCTCPAPTIASLVFSRLHLIGLFRRFEINYLCLTIMGVDTYGRGHHTLEAAAHKFAYAAVQPGFIDAAVRLTARCGLEGRCSFICCSATEMPLETDAFDHVFAQVCVFVQRSTRLWCFVSMHPD